MSSSYETCTKEKVISYEQRQFIKTALRRIGINSNNNGFILFQKAIIYAYKKDMITKETALKFAANPEMLKRKL